MALVIDPGFSSNRKFYTCQATTSNVVEVVAWTINTTYSAATRINDPLVGDIPAAGRHSGCRLRFGPQGYLWIATGDAASGTIPQDRSSLGGKVLRVQASSGAGAPGNPFADAPLIYTYGHRNIQGLAVRPGTSQMWIVEHGPTFDDEINLLTAGGNYGWDPVPGYNESVPMTDLTKFPAAIEARWSSGSSTLATSGGIFLQGAKWGKWNGWLAVASLKEQTLRLFHFASDGTFMEQVNVPEMNGMYGRLRTPMLGPDGSLYVTTSNGADDKILKITPASGGGGGGGGGATVRDTHGNSPRRATAITLTPQQLAPTQRGNLVSRTDIDYFVLDLPLPGLLWVESQSRLNTRGHLFDAEEQLVVEDDDSGQRRNFRIATAVPQGVHYLAVDSPSRSTGAYTLRIDYRPGYLEIPGDTSAQSGIGLVSGWVCDAETIVIEFESAGVVQETEAAYGTEREASVAAECGDSAAGFGLLLNWNNLGAGEHTVRAVVDGVVLAAHTVAVTTLGEAFRRGLRGRFTLRDFPHAGERTPVGWVEGQQNFMLAEDEAPHGAGDTAGPYPQLQFENPGAGTYQSGVGVLSGWICEAETVAVVFTAEDGREWRTEAAYGTERVDTQEPCGDVDNGFGVLFNWNTLGEGVHVVELLVDGAAVAQSTIRVTTLGEEFVRGLRGTYTLEGFPTPAETTTIKWQQRQQNFVITAVTDRTAEE